MIVATHPIQYQVPWYQYLETHLTEYHFHVLYLTIPDAEKQGVGFGHSFQWDIPMLEGYRWTQLKANHLRGDQSLDKFLSIRLKQTRRLINTMQPDAVLLTGWQCLALVQLSVCLRKLKIPSLIRADSNDLKPRAIYKSLIHRWLMRQYNRYLAVGQANRNFYLANRVNADDIFDCPYFVDNDYFKDKSNLDVDKRHECRNKWQITDNTFCFCYVGKLNPKKRILDVLNALNKLSDDNVMLIIVGDGELMVEAKAYTRTHGLNVSFTGFLNQSEIPVAYAVSDCLILASDYEETWGLVVNEAMASGIPAIVSRRSGCHPDLIIEGITGYSFEFGDTEDLSQKMRTMTSFSKTEYQSICKNAQLNILENYNVSAASAGLRHALKSII